jgi:hypothetical protein
LGFTFIQADTDPMKELVALTNDGVYLADAVLEASPRTFTFRPKPVPGVSPGKAVAADDMNGDRFDDLIIAQNSEILIYTGTPARP